MRAVAIMHKAPMLAMLAAARQRRGRVAGAAAQAAHVSRRGNVDQRYQLTRSALGTVNRRHVTVKRRLRARCSSFVQRQW